MIMLIVYHLCHYQPEQVTGEVDNGVCDAYGVCRIAGVMSPAEIAR